MSYENRPSTLTLLKRRCARGKPQLFILVSVFMVMTVFVYLKRNGDPESTARDAFINSDAAVVPVQDTGAVPTIHSKLLESEFNWLKDSMIRNEAENKLKTEDDLIALSNSYKKEKFWSFFNASFECPYKVERVGRQKGDGGKWICGFSELALKPKCVVYSFGIFNEHTFEEDVARRTNCTLHMFEWDHNIKAPKWAAEFPRKVTYTNLGIGNKNTEHLRTLKTFMEANNDEYADIFKIDTEGWEWPSMDNIIKDYPEKLPFGQMQVEVHIHLFKPKDQYVAMRNFWFSLEQAGLRPFYREYNMPLYFEFSFLNIRQDLFNLGEDVNSKLMKWTWDPKYQMSFLKNIELDYNI